MLLVNYRITLHESYSCSIDKNKEKNDITKVSNYYNNLTNSKFDILILSFSIQQQTRISKTKVSIKMMQISISKF